ncbi:DUF2987 domain-containing protein [Pseudoalteromonas sp. MMG010]|uniref:DUF2987 domain-containing protein n=1 Tax=Pseudoalteromonas sp. MMG010 TaxID=2822685 RepID=UPI001FFD33D3|nr:DUF2987 domain-containing protein [Pseudoalteromonas sp. MMG010]
MTLGLFVITAINSVYAKEFVMSYDGFYDRLKVVNKGDFQYAQVNFYISDIGTNQTCAIKSGTILTEKNEYPLNFTEHAQLLLPFDKQLDTDKAVVVVEPVNPLHDCQLKLQIEAKEFSSLAFTKHNLFIVHNELDKLLTDLSGFFVSKLMWFLLPEQKGVVVTFTQPQDFSSLGVKCEQTVCYFAVDDSYEQNTQLIAADVQIVKVTPWIAK